MIKRLKVLTVAVAFAALAFVLFGMFGVSIGSEDDCTKAFRAVCRAVRIAE